MNTTDVVYLKEVLIKIEQYKNSELEILKEVVLDRLSVLEDTYN